ncbi:TIGR02444 family protein [Methylopila turkensis]|uniref:TIGR02444 family protein n=1 Tax=Methylopila turkensis TaxID=1437816 RepID=A0A9W6JKM1_9HYPH|nr:TIGR02444 family protein [Methylopila turkensis]GLK78932.1 hypothetical protein GCM10008174_06730 [Methylopila turkensis]
MNDAPASEAREPDDPHWRFALAVYSRPGVAPACLALQDRFGVDVNVLLVALYAATQRGLAVGQEEIAALDRAVAPWRAVAVAPLRSIRRALKSFSDTPRPEDVQTLRGQLQKLEIESERLAQSILAAALREFGAKSGDRGAADVLTATLAYYAPTAVPDQETLRASSIICNAAENYVDISSSANAPGSCS